MQCWMVFGCFGRRVECTKKHNILRRKHFENVNIVGCVLGENI